MGKVLRVLTVCSAGLLAVAASVLLFAWLPSLSRTNVTAQTAAFGNGGFEGTYVEWGSADRKIAPSWMLWYTTSWPGEYNAPPKAGEEYSEKLSGEKAQRVYAEDWKNFDACLYQQISGITVGHYVRFAAWAKVLAHEWLDSPEKWQTRVGIDPNGGTNPLDINYYTHQSLWDTYTVNKGEWQKLSVVFMASSPTATVYACAHPTLARPFSVYWDDAEFSVVPEQRVHLPLALRDYCPLPSGTLLNPDLERDFCALHGYQPHSTTFKLDIAPYWMPFCDYREYDTAYKVPECGPIDSAERSYRVHSGSTAQQCGTSGGGAFAAGIYQVITGTNVSDTLQFTIWGLGWTQEWSGNDPDGYNELVSDSPQPGGLNFRVGIDPCGGESFDSPAIVWSDYRDPYDAWSHLEVTATAACTRVSVWAYAHPTITRFRWNQTFWDGAGLELVSEP